MFYPPFFSSFLHPSLFTLKFYFPFKLFKNNFCGTKAVNPEWEVFLKNFKTLALRKRDEERAAYVIYKMFSVRFKF